LYDREGELGAPPCPSDFLDGVLYDLPALPGAAFRAPLLRVIVLSFRALMP
jgi:hypothetical protein